MKIFLILGAALAAASVGLGAFGAHGLSTVLTANNRLANWETAAQYHMYHSLALILVGIAYQFYPVKYLQWAGWAFIGGILVFSGSLYILSLTNVSKWGAVTPIGGLALLAGWGLFLYGIIKA